MAAPSWAPTVQQVASLLHARTMEGYGDEAGTFTSTTRPSATQVDELIEDACNDIIAEVGSIPAEVEDQAGTVAKFGAAMLIELSFFPNQVGDDPDLYDRLKEQYDARLARLVRSAQDYAVEPIDESSPNASNFLDSGFPDVIGTSLLEGF